MYVLRTDISGRSKISNPFGFAIFTPCLHPHVRDFDWLIIHFSGLSCSFFMINKMIIISHVNIILKSFVTFCHPTLALKNDHSIIKY